MFGIIKHYARSRTRDAAMGQILPNRCDVGARPTAPESCQALRDARGSIGVPEDFQGQLQTLKIIHRQQNDLRLSVPGQDDPLMLLAYRLASSDRRALASDNGTGVAAIVMIRSIDP
jgi:hypothetical protein